MPSPIVDRAMELARVDLSPRHRPPNLAAVAIATVASLVLCLLADWLLAKLAVAVFPADKGYVHFQFSDYAKLTIIGVLIACIAWPIVARVTSDPRWVFFRLAILVTIVLLLPDLYIWLQRAAVACRTVPGLHAPGHRADHLQPPGARGPGARGRRRRPARAGPP